MFLLILLGLHHSNSVEGLILRVALGEGEGDLDCGRVGFTVRHTVVEHHSDLVLQHASVREAKLGTDVKEPQEKMVHKRLLQ